MSNKDLGKVIAIQVAPWKHIEDGSPEGSIEIQVDGADQETKGYGVYSRHENGMAMHRIDFDFEAAAVKYAVALCNDFGVKIEPYGWQVGTVHFGPDIVIDDSRAFEAFALRQNFIKDVQRYDFNHPDKEKAGKYGHFDTANARVMWDGAVAWTVAMMGHLGMSRDYLNGGDVRVVVEGRTGVGKSALCGIIAEKMKALGIPVTWNEQEYESNRQDRPWEVELQELLLGGTVKIVERNLVPAKVYAEMEPSRKFSALATEVLSSTMTPASEHRPLIEDSISRGGIPVGEVYYKIAEKKPETYPKPVEVDHKQLLMLRSAVDEFLSMNMFHLEGTEQERAAQFESIKRVLISRLWNTFPGVTVPDEPTYYIGGKQVTKEQYDAAGQSNNGMKPSHIRGEVIEVRRGGQNHTTEFIVKWENGMALTHQYGNTSDGLAFLRTGMFVYTDDPSNPSYITPGTVIRQADTHEGVNLKPEIYPGPDGEQQ